MSEDRIEAIKEFVSFLERKKDVNVSGDLYVGNVNFLLTEIAELRATIAEKDKENERLKNRIVGLSNTLDAVSDSARNYYVAAFKAESELAEIRPYADAYNGVCQSLRIEKTY